MMKITLALACIAVVLAVMHVQPTSAEETQGPELNKALEDLKAEIADQQLEPRAKRSVGAGRCVSRD